MSLLHQQCHAPNKEEDSMFKNFEVRCTSTSINTWILNESLNKFEEKYLFFGEFFTYRISFSTKCNRHEDLYHSHTIHSNKLTNELLNMINQEFENPEMTINIAIKVDSI